MPIVSNLTVIGGGSSEYSAGDIWLLPYWMGRYLNIYNRTCKLDFIYGFHHLSPVGYDYPVVFKELLSQQDLKTAEPPRLSAATNRLWF